MGITLTSKSIASTYDGLLKLSDNDPLSGAFKVVTDGFGNESGIQLNNSGDVNISGILNVGTRVNTPIVQLTGGTADQGTLSWNADEETVDLIQNGTTLQLGQGLEIHVKNQTGTTIPKGAPVRAAGTLGASGRILIAPMIADGTIEGKYFLGVANEAIANGEDGKVITFGKIRGIDTSAYSEGQTLWVSSTSAGNFQTTRPLAPNLDLEVAIVINSSVNNGTIFVRSTIGHYIGTAHDVNISSVAENDLLVYKTNRWVNTKSIGDLSAANVTLSGYLRGPATFVIDPAAYGDETGLVQILGDLRVDGTTTTINSTTISVSDKNITLAKDAVTAGDANGAGITIAGANATLTYLSATDDFTFNKNVNASRFVGPLTGDVTGTVSTLSNHDTDDLNEGLTNLYFTTTRARDSFSAGTGVAINAGEISIGQSVGTTDNVTFGIVTASLSGNASTASALQTARNIALDGSVTGNADFDGSGNITITTTTNHNHDDRYYTETESDNRFVNVSGDTMTGDLTLNYAYPRINLYDTNNDSDYSIINNDGAFSVYDITNQAHRFSISNTGNISVSNNLIVAGDLTLDDKLTITGTTNNLVIDEEADGTWHLYDTFQDNGIVLYSGSGGMEFQYQGVTEMTIDGGGVSFTGTINLDAADLNIGAADIIFDTTSGGAVRGLIWNVAGEGFLSKISSGGIDSGKVTIYTNIGTTTVGSTFEIYGANGLGLSLSNSGVLTAGGGTSTQWNTAYSWGDHDGLYLPIGGKAADSELLDGIDSSRVVYGSGANKSTAFDGGNINTALASGFYDGLDMVGAPTASAYYHLIHARHNNEGNNYAMQLASHFFSDSLYYRQITNNVASAWRTIIHSGNIGSQSVSYATSAGTATTANNALALSGYALDGATSVATRIFNNKGQVHGTYTDFNTAMTPGPNYLQGGTNSPSGVANSQWYGFLLGLGSEYNTETGNATSYASQLYWSRQGTPSPTPYLWARDMEGGTWGSWRKMAAGYADTAGSALVADVASTANYATTSGSTNSVIWGNVSSTPTTLQGYGITSGYITGEVGIGTTSPNNKLTVAWTDPNALSVYRDLDINAVGAAGTYINMGARDGASFKNGARLVGVLNNSTDGAFYIDTLRSGTLTTAVSVLGNGNVGIGTSPSYKLEVNGTGYFSQLAHFGQAAASGSAFRWGTLGTAVSPDSMLCHNQLYNGGGWTILSASFGTSYINLGAADASPNITFGTGPANTEASVKMIIKNSGLVGIGTTNPGAKLQVEGFNSNGLIQAYVTSGGGNALRLNSNFANGNYIDINPYITGVSNGGFEISQNGERRFVISSGGFIGIGTTSPSQKLHIDGSSAGLNFTGGNNRIYFNGYRAIEGAQDGSALQIGEGYTNTFLQSSKVGIGTTLPIVKLHVADSNGGRMVLQGVGGSGINWQFNSYTDGKLYIGNYNVADYMTLTSAGSVGIGTTSPAMKLSVAGGILAAGSGGNNLYGVYVSPTNENTFNSGYGSDDDTRDLWLNYRGYNDGFTRFRAVRIGNGKGVMFAMFDGPTGNTYLSTGGGKVGVGFTTPTAKFEVRYGGSNGSGGLSDYGIVTTCDSTNQATIGSVHDGDGYANLNLASNVGGLKMWHISKRTALDSHRLEYFYYDGGFTSRFAFMTNGDFHADGDVIAYSSTISDQRLKDDVKTIDNALGKVKAMRGVEYVWNEGSRKGQKDLGLIAQEVEQVLPEIVREKETIYHGEEGKYKTVDYEKIVGVLIEAIKEQQQQIDELKALLNVSPK